MFFQTALLAALASRVASHATFQDLWVNGVDQGAFCVRLPLSNNPVTDVTSTVSLLIGPLLTLYSPLSIGPYM